MFVPLADPIEITYPEIEHETFAWLGEKVEEALVDKNDCDCCGCGNCGCFDKYPEPDFCTKCNDYGHLDTDEHVSDPDDPKEYTK